MTDTEAARSLAATLRERSKANVAAGWVATACEYENAAKALIALADKLDRLRLQVQNLEAEVAMLTPPSPEVLKRLEALPLVADISTDRVTDAMRGDK